MKKIIYLLFVIFLIFQSGGLFLIYRVEQHIQQIKMNRILERNNSVVENFTLSRETFNKSRISRKEISVYGKMYDIKSFSFYGNLVRLSVIRDKKEEWIICALKNALRDGNEHDNGLLVKIVKLLSLDYTLPSLLQDDFLTYSEKKHLPVLSELLHFRIADILTPPPEAA